MVLFFAMIGFFTVAVANEARGSASGLIVYNRPLCFCCKRWIGHLKDSGLQVSAVLKLDMEKVKRQWGIPKGMEACHTAVWHERYIFEGHVPAVYIRKFLASPPEGSVGLLVPGMPVGSPGMEAQGAFAPYNIYLLLKNGDYRLYARVENPGAV
ncbi:DUF411 domain-containing protein [Microbulbifer sp. 2304DJ12-6]|uniref:DUF411 domain-containing protein n=2 Tax=Microbulbifer TaxID=48073 RepID=UPI0039B07CB0